MMYVLIILVAVLFTCLGAGLVRYGMGLGTKIVYQTKEGLPLDTDEVEFKQENTEEAE